MSVLEQSNNIFIIRKFDINDLLYRGEGNSSLVVALFTLNKVIRIPKVLKSQSQNDINLDIIRRDLIQEIEFSCNVMGNLFKPNNWINKYSLIELSKQQMIEISNKIENLRPDYRKVKTLPIQDYFGLLIDDYCSFHIEQLKVVREKFPNLEITGPIFSIEIKPKQGFILKESNNLKVCKFILKQHEKLKLSLIEQVSNYCPLDLFSGEKKRMRFALISLMNNPQNNFRLFINKVHIELKNDLNENLRKFGDTNLNQEKLLDLLIFVLNHPFNNVKSEDADNLPIEQLKCEYHSKLNKFSLVNQLKSNSILKSILEVQKLDQIGSNKARQLYALLKTKHRLLFNEWKYEMENSTEPINLYDEQLNEVDQIKKDLTKYLYSLTAKDCSILITFQKVLNIPLTYIESIKKENCTYHLFHSDRVCLYSKDNSVYLFSLALIDLCRKQVKKVNTKFLNDQTRIEEFLKLNN